METILAHFDGKFIVPDQPLSFPAGQALRIGIEAVLPPVFPNLPAELESKEDGMIVVRGTRIPLYLVAEALFQGKSQVDIQSEFPSIPGSSIPQIKRFVEQHEAATRTYCESEKAVLDKQYSEGRKAPTLESLRTRASGRAHQA